jgi:hypothetical protein
MDIVQAQQAPAAIGPHSQARLPRDWAAPAVDAECWL